MNHREGWTQRFQEFLLAAFLHGDLGVRASTLPASLFDEGGHRDVALTIQKFCADYGAWPSKDLLEELVQSESGKVVATRIVRVLPSHRRYAADKAQIQIRRRAIEEFLFDAQDLLEGDPSRWGEMPGLLTRSLQTASKAPESFDYAQGLLERHEPSSINHGVLTAPTGLRALDDALQGGLRGGEHGIILGATKMGKSHIGIAFAAHHLKHGGRVMAISLELRRVLMAQRFDRALTGFDTIEIRDNPSAFQKEWERVVPNPGRLDVRFAPRFSIGVADVKQMVDERLDSWGSPFLLLLDYGAILQPSRQDKPHIEVGRIHEEISAMCQEFMIPCWSPFQTNRSALFAETERVTKAHAGASFEAMQHVDVIATMNQSAAQKHRHRMTIALDGVRDGGEAEAEIRYDWARSTMEEVNG